MENNLKNILISCIVPVYNGAEYLHSFLNSLMNQTFQDIEIICVDDASTDLSSSILRQYEKQNKLIHIRNKCNMGAAESRNKGLSQAKGEYVIFFDCDDILHPEMLERMYDKCKEYNADMGICYFEGLKDGKCIPNGFKERNKEMISTYPVIENPANFQYLFQILTNCPFDKMVRRDILLKNHIKFQDLPCCNDMYYSYVSVLCSERIVYIDKVLYFYRMEREGGISSNWNGIKNFVCEAYDAIFDFLQKKKYYHSIQKSFLENAVKVIYMGLNHYTPDYYKETIDHLKTTYLEKWGILKLYNQHELSEVQRYMVSVMNGEQEWEPYYNILLICSCIKIKKLTEEIHGINQKIVWWGAGKVGLRFLRYFRKKLINIDYIVDMDPKKLGMEVEGYHIIDWDFIKSDVNVILVTNDAWISDIRKKTGGSVKILNIIRYMEEGELR